MGNYMETCIQRSEQTEENPQAAVQEKDQQQQEYGKTNSNNNHKGMESSSSKMRVKVVLTKVELDWLLLQLKGNQEGKSLEDVLANIEKSRMNGKSVGGGWKPSLESIMETPEVHRQMNRS